MAIKWKNNERKEFLSVEKGCLKGLLLILLCTAVAATIMCSAYPFFRKRAAEKLETLQRQYEFGNSRKSRFSSRDDSY